MSYINWSDKFSVKVQEIDEQHDGLINMINKLQKNLLGEQEKEVQREIINDMMEYVRVHFKTEEKYMLQFNFQGYEEHKKEHEAFTQKALDIKNAFEITGCILTLAMLDFLKDWMENHFLNTDMKYVECFNKNGLH